MMINTLNLLLFQRRYNLSFEDKKATILSIYYPRL